MINNRFSLFFLSILVMLTAGVGNMWGIAPAVRHNASASSSHHYTFAVNGVIVSQGDAEEGAAIPFPTDPADQGGKTFYCWYADDYSHATTAPAKVTSATMGAQDITFKAVFATSAGEPVNRYKYVSISPLNTGKTYVFVSSNVAGDAFALDGSLLTTQSNERENGKAVSITESGEDKIISTIDANLEFKYNGHNDIDVVCSTTGEKLKINGTGIGKNKNDCIADWNSNGLFGKKTDNSLLYVKYASGVFKANAGYNTRVYAFEKETIVSYSNYTTSLGINPQLSVACPEYYVSEGAKMVSPLVNAADGVAVSYAVSAGADVTINASSGELSLGNYTQRDITITASAEAAGAFPAQEVSYQLHVVAPLTVNVGAAGWATYAPSLAVQLPAEGIDRTLYVYYIRESAETEEGETTIATTDAYETLYADESATFQEKIDASTSYEDLPVATIVAGTGILVKAAAGTYSFPVNTTAAPTPLTKNRLVGVLASTARPGNNAYILKNGSQGVGFYPWESGNLAANKCYLQLPKPIGNAAAPAFVDCMLEEQRNDVATGVEDNEDVCENEDKPVKFMLKGKLYIRIADRTYDASGRLVK